MNLLRKLGSTSNIVRVKLRNSSTGAGLTGLTFSSSGLIISTICDVEASATAYTAAGSTIETISSLGTYQTPTTATKCRFKEVDATNHPGLYELHLADARFAVTNAKSLKINLSGATNLLDKEITIRLTSLDVDDAAAAGLSRLDAAVTSRLAPTVAGRTLDVAATGEAGLDFDNIKDATGAHTLTNITVPVTTAVTNPVTLAAAQSFVNANPARDFGLNPLDGYSNVAFRIDEKLGVSAGSNGYMTAWLDQSGNAANPTVTAAPRYVLDEGGKAIFEFDYPGAGAYLDLPAVTIDRRNFLFAWDFEAHDLYPGTLGGGQEFLFGGTGDALNIYIDQGSGNLGLRITDSGGYGQVPALYVRNRPDNVLVVSGDATGLRVLLNGVAVTLPALTAGTFSGGRLGQKAGSTASAFRGRMKDFAIRTAASTFAEMEQVAARLHAKHRIATPRITVNVFGDSLALGMNTVTKTDRNLAWPYLAAEGNPLLEVRNFSLSGMSASQAVAISEPLQFKNFGGAFAAGTAHVAIIALVSNDMAALTAPATIAGYVQTLIDSCRTQGAAAVIVVGFTPRAGINLASFNDINDRLAALTHDGFVDPRDDSRFALNDPTDLTRYVSTDTTHLNAQGQIVMGRLFRAVLDRVVAKVLGDVYVRANAVYRKLPSKTYLAGSNNADGDVQMDEATGNFPGSVGAINGVTFPAGFSTLTVGNIQSGLASQLSVNSLIGWIVDGDIATMADRFLLMTQSNGAGDFQFDALALALAPTGGGGGGGGGSLVISPLLASAANPRYSSRDLARIAAGSGPADVLTIVDGTRAPVDLSGRTLRLVAALLADAGGDDEPTAPFDDTLAGAFKYETGGAGLSVGGTSNNQVTVQHDPAKTATPGDYLYWLWDVTSPAAPIVLVKGRMPIEPAVVDV